jgi:hypothetical protein
VTPLNQETNVLHHEKAGVCSRLVVKFLHFPYEPCSLLIDAFQLRTIFQHLKL